MADQYVGKLKRNESKAGNEYFKGFFGNVPIVGFWGNKEPDSINLKLDVGFIKWKDEQDAEKPEKFEKPEERVKSDDLPF